MPWADCALHRISWTIKNIVGKGIGIVATDDIPAGTELLAERPLFTLPPSAGQRESETAINGLSGDSKQKFSSLCNSFPELGLYGIVKTNAFSLGTDDQPRHSGVFDILSRLNHSCIPNCERWWNEEKGMETLYTIKSIETGEELTIQYHGELRRIQRRNYILQVWRFDCNCECCRLIGEEQKLSDLHRTLIEHIVESIGSINTKADLRRAVLQVKRAVDYTKAEGIRGSLLARVCYDGYQISLLASNLGEARRYIDMAYDEYLLGTGPDSLQTKLMKGYLDNPKSHRNWTMRGFFR